jgi:hypothetical protein
METKKVRLMEGLVSPEAMNEADTWTLRKADTKKI